MKRRWFALLIVVGEVVGSGLMASFDPSVAVAQKLDCQKALNQQELNQCAALSAREADRKLNQIYQQLRKEQRNQSNTLLINAEEAWIKYRDASCAFSRSQFEGGSIAPLIYSDCIARLTKQRTQELKSHLQKG